MKNTSIYLEPMELERAQAQRELQMMLDEEYTHRPYPVSMAAYVGEHAKLFWAMSEGQRIGMTGYILKSPTLAETVKTIVFKKARGRGLGKTLSQMIEDQCREDGITKVMTTIYADNHTMISIKLKQGYTVEGFHPSHEAPGWDEYSLGKILT